MKAPKGDIMNNIQRHSLMCLLALAIGLPATVAIAQDQGAFIEEIIVTAQKREQSLQDVPISVSVVTGDKIVEAGINNLDDLALYVPNFSKGESGAGAIIQSSCTWMTSRWAAARWHACRSWTSSASRYCVDRKTFCSARTASGVQFPL
jgi:hypothetical protein